MSSVYYPGDEPVPGYRLVRLLGHGSIGEVWASEGPSGRQIALKRVRLDLLPGMRDLNLLHYLKSLSHPHLLSILAYWLKHPDGTIVDEEAVNGAPKQLEPTVHATELILALPLGNHNLQDRLAECLEQQRGGIPAEELLAYMAEAADGIDYLNQPVHNLGQGAFQTLGHCNIKPQNLILDNRSIRIADHGLAYLLGPHLSTITAYSLTYVAPELLKENKPGPHTDQYALAVTYTELRTGLRPYSSTLMLDIYTQKLQGRLDFSHVAEREAAVLRRATSVDPSQRYGNTAEFIDQLRQSVAPSLLAVSHGTPQEKLTSKLDTEGTLRTSAPAPTNGTLPPTERTETTMPSGARQEMELVPGYRLQHLIGHGVYGEVWSTCAPDGDNVALKIISNLNAKLSLPEVRSLQHLKEVRHKHLQELYGIWLLDRGGRVIGDEEFGQEGCQVATLVIASRLARKSLAARLKECQAAGQTGIPLIELLPTIMQAALAIDYLNMPVHNLGKNEVALPHRNIKPENLLLLDQQVVTVADFGLALVIEAATNTLRSSAQAVMLAYTAPEQFAGQVSPQTDQYSLAITWYQLRTGQLPFPPLLTQQQYILRHMNGQLDFHRVSPEEEAVLRQATARIPEDRFPCCVRLVQALGAAVGIPVTLPADALASASRLSAVLSANPFATGLPSLSTADIFAHQQQQGALSEDHLRDTQCVNQPAVLVPGSATTHVSKPKDNQSSNQVSAVIRSDELPTVQMLPPCLPALRIPELEESAIVENTIVPGTAPLPQQETRAGTPGLPEKSGRSSVNHLAIILCFCLGTGIVVGIWWLVPRNEQNEQGMTGLRHSPASKSTSSQSSPGAKATGIASSSGGGGLVETSTNQAKPKAPPFDLARWRQALQAVDQENWELGQEIVKELKSAIALPTAMRPKLRALEWEIQVLGKEGTNLRRAIAEMRDLARHHTDPYVQYVLAMGENALGERTEAARILMEVDANTSELSPRRLERGREVLLQCIRANRPATKTWLSPFTSMENANRVFRWATAVGRWESTGFSPVDIRLARALACWHKELPDPGTTLSLVAPLLQLTERGKLSAPDRCALLWVRAQAAARLGSVDGVHLSLEAYAQLRELIRTDRALQPGGEIYLLKVLRPALQLQPKLGVNPVAWPRPSRLALAALHAEQGRVVLENPLLDMKGEDLGRLALDSFSQAIAWEPTNAVYHAGRAWAWSSFRLPRLDIAAMERDAQEALRHDDNLPLAYWAMGFVHHRRALQVPIRLQRLQGLKLAINWYTQAIDRHGLRKDQDGDRARYLIARSSARILAAREVESNPEVRMEFLKKGRADAVAATLANPYPPECAWEALGDALEAMADLGSQSEAQCLLEAMEKFSIALKERNTAKYLLARGRCRTKAMLKNVAPMSQSVQAHADLEQALLLNPSTSEETEIRHWLTILRQHSSRK